MVLRRIFGPKRDEVREWSKLQGRELNILYSSSNIIRLIKSSRMRWAGHAARMGEERKCTRFRWEITKEGVHSEDRGVDGRIGLK
jgi:hypothetical protein